MVPPSGSAGTAGMRSLGGSGVDQVRVGEVGACSTRGEGLGGSGTGAAGGGGEATGGGGTGAAGGGVAITGLGGSGDAAGAGGSGDTAGDRGAGAGSGAAGVSTREGDDSPRLRHGRGRWPGRSRLAQQARRPLRGEDLQSAHSWRNAHEPDNEAQHDDVEGERARHADAARHCWGAPPGVDGQRLGMPLGGGARISHESIVAEGAGVRLRLAACVREPPGRLEAVSPLGRDRPPGSKRGPIDESKRGMRRAKSRWQSAARSARRRAFRSELTVGGGSGKDGCSRGERQAARPA